MRTRYAIVAAMLMAALIVLVTPLALAASPRQTQQPLNIGVIGPADGPTAEGLTLALQRFSDPGVFTTPDGINHTLAVITADASTPQQVTDAVTALKKNNVFAIFGPDDDALAAASLPALTAAGVPVFTGATATAIQTGGLVFRTRAADNWRMAALADVLITDLNKNKFAIFQGNPNVGGPVGDLVSILTKLGKAPAQPVIQTPDGKIQDAVQVLMQSSPNTIVAFGDSAQVADLYRTLRANNFAGTFATPDAENQAFISALPEALRSGIYGVSNWPFSWGETNSLQFLRDYVTLFAKVPTPLAVASYDTGVALLFSAKNAGITPDALHNAILNFAKENSLQGIFNAQLGNNALTASVSIIVTNHYGAPTLVARYEDTGRVKIPVQQPTTVPPLTLTPSPTPAGVVATVKSTLNVRTGPGANYPVIGQLKQGDQVPLIGANADFSWFVIDFRQQNGWISAPLVSVFGDVRTLPNVAPPPTPIPSETPPATALPPATSTSIPPQFADLALVSATLNPPVLKSGQPFTLAVTIVNQGARDAGTFAVATSFLPGNVYSAVNVNGLAAGAQTTVNLTGTVTGSGDFTIAIVLDLNNQVDEGPTGKANNKPQFTYHVNP